MRASLSRWIGDADALRHLEYFHLTQPSLQLSPIRARSGDYYIALVGELFDAMRLGNAVPADWARLGNALSHFAQGDQDLLGGALGVSRSEAALFSACAFYFGGFPASAYLTIRDRDPAEFEGETHRACFDLLRRPSAMQSEIGSALLGALRGGSVLRIQEVLERATVSAAEALLLGPNEWIPGRLFEQLMRRFAATNVRAILPDGENEFWTPFVSSLLDRTPATWEFFPSQIAALQRGLLERTDTFSLQMPTGAGKTTLCETLLYWHGKRAEGSVAVMLVPFRALAAELRNSLVKRLNALGISARCAYGGTVPTGDEVTDLHAVRVMVATPEALSGVLSADADFFGRISLVICDEGHLLDGGERGVGLELLLARMRARGDGGPRAVFLSAIVPNIEEINAWLGGTPDTVVRSDYRPALAEFAVLRSTGRNQSLTVALDMHPHELPPVRFAIAPFLSRQDFRWLKPETQRLNVYPFGSHKTQAIAAARRALPMGAAAVFAANKRGNQGAVGLAEELIGQLRSHLPLPEPAAFSNVERVRHVEQYLTAEYGPAWIGTQMVQFGAILHHGDIPQETREVLELLLRRGDIRLAVCTSTLAEGVNLPIRTLVLYSVQRRSANGSEALLTRDIKNLVGRAGRAGASTKGLVICANSEEWPIVEQVARQAPGEPVRGALRELVERVKDRLALQNIALNNQILENSVALHTLIDGIDATLIDLATEEIGEPELETLARQLADKTFASQQAQLQASKDLLQEVFVLRARRIIGVRAAGRLPWIRETGARVRMLDSVENDLLSRRPAWDDLTDPVDANLIQVILDWAWKQREMQAAVRQAYRLDGGITTETLRQPFFELVASWLAGDRFVQLAIRADLSIDDVLGVHTHVVTFVLQTLVEQGIALLERLLAAQGTVMSGAVRAFPDHLRFGVPTEAARLLASKGLRHRRASIELGREMAGVDVAAFSRAALFGLANQMLADAPDVWTTRLGHLVFENTLRDVT